MADFIANPHHKEVPVAEVVDEETGEIIEEEVAE
jgi:hypothetical protein